MKFFKFIFKFLGWLIRNGEVHHILIESSIEIQIREKTNQWTHNVVSTSIRCLYDIGDVVYRRFKNIETSLSIDGFIMAEAPKIFQEVIANQLTMDKAKLS